MKFFVTAALSITALSACGRDDRASQGNNQAPATQPSANATRPAELPAGLIVRVPVAAGVESYDHAQSAQLTSGSTLSSGAAIATNFDGAQTVKLGDELDRDTSAQQWFWDTPWYPGKLLGRGTWWGRNPYYSYGGSNYGYSYQSSYSDGGYNYYQYGCNNSYYNNSYY